MNNNTLMKRGYGGHGLDEAISNDLPLKEKGDKMEIKTMHELDENLDKKEK